MGVVTQPQRSFYDEVGGHDTFNAIVSRFYQLVREDEILRPLYPEEDLDAAEVRLRMFLEQYWGGPRTYSDQRGHPRLRMRHSPFEIGFIERDAWLRCMHTAVASIDSETLDDEHRKQLLAYLEMAAQLDGQFAVLGRHSQRIRRLVTDQNARPWWSHAVFYQVYPRSFCDSERRRRRRPRRRDGAAGLPRKLGVDAIWLNPVMVSPMADHGYDVSDPRDVDPLFGGMEALDRLIEAAHARGIKVTMDLVPNHTSSAHPWFQAALAAGPGTDARERYIFRDGTGPGGVHPPNNWVSIFGGPAWTRVTEPDGNPGQYYLHLFDAEQPDLNWENREVYDDLEKTLRFWLERGVDGFRIDVAHGMSKPPGLPDMEVIKAEVLLADMDDDPRFNHDGVHDIHRHIRTVLNDYPHAVAIGEVWVYDNEQFARYLRADELHLGFNFRLLRAEFDAAEIRGAIENSLAAAAIENATPTWTLSNHDVDREVTRYGGGSAGLARAWAMALVMLALPGAVFIYNGEELGLRQRGPARRGAARPGVGTLRAHPARARRVPGADAVGGRRSPVRLLDESRHLAAAPAGVVDADRREAVARPRLPRLSFYRRPCDCGWPKRIRGHCNRVAGRTGRRAGVPGRRWRAGVRVERRRHALALPAGEVLLASGELVDGKLPPNTAAWLA